MGLSVINANCVITILLLLGLAACNTPPVAEQSVPQISTQTPLDAFTTNAATAPTPQISTAADSKLTTRRLTPTPIRITVADLPQPFATNSVSKSPKVIPIPEQPILNVPEGFEINVFASELDHPRWLALTPRGDVLVTETRQNRITLLGDRNSDGVSDLKQTFATARNGLNQPFGMAFVGNNFFLGNTDSVLRFPYQTDQTQLTNVGQKIATLPADGYNNHWTRNVVAAPDGQKLYVSIGSASNVDEEPLPRASVQSMKLDGSSFETVASGLRNPVGLDFHPITQELYATVNERDGLGDDLVPDYLTRIQPNQFYGWPYAYLSPNRLDPNHLQGDRSTHPELVAKTQTPDVLFQAHSAALGLKFYDGTTFPNHYRNGAFVAFRGSWNRDEGTGYKIVYVPFNTNHRPAGYYEDFVTGFLTDPSGPTTWGRPVGLLVMPDGSLLFTEEANGKIYRVQYHG